MDFLLLLPNQQRVVIEVDGSQHLSADGEPSLPQYAKMVAADRELRLAGYEVYRFGANELVGPAAAAVIERFFVLRGSLGTAPPGRLTLACRVVCTIWP